MTKVAVAPGSKVVYENPDQYGPITKRKCRDVFFLILFILFWIGMGWIAYQAFLTGQPLRLLYGTDTFGNLCGFNNKGTGNLTDMTNNPYLLYFDPTNPNAYRICVSSCPNTTAIATPSTAICVYNTTITGSNIAAQTSDLYNKVTDGLCMGYTIESSPVLFRCLPFNVDLSSLSDSNSPLYNSSTNSSSSQAGGVTALINSRQLIQQVIGDFQSTWQWILIAGGAAVVVSFIWLILLQLLAGVFVWGFILAILGGCGVSVWFSYSLWQQILANLNATPASDRTSDMNNQERASFALFVIVSVISGILLLIVLAMRNRIRIAIQIIKEASRAIGSMPLIVFLPIPMFMILLGLVAYTVIIYMYLATAQSAVQLPNGIVQYNSNDLLQYFQWYHIFGFLWGVNFLTGITQCTIAGGIASYYWTLDKKSGLRSMPITRSLYRVFRYHLGSIALGSLIIALVQFIRIILAKLQKYTRAKSNPVLKYIFICLSCCFACFERFMKFISKNAYIEVAVYGYSFCRAAQAAFELLVRNAFRLVAVDAVSVFVFFLGKIFICGVVGFGAYYKFKDMNLQFYFLPVAVCVIFAYIVASLFMYVYHMAIDTIFLCFCEDCERNDGVTKPYYMSVTLQRITNQTNKIAPAVEYQPLESNPSATPQVKKVW